MGVDLEHPDAPTTTADTTKIAQKSGGGAKVCSTQDTLVSNITVDEYTRRSAARSKHLVRFSDGVNMMLEYAWFFELVESGSLIKHAVRVLLRSVRGSGCCEDV
ncbi:hypothetical protein RRF57_003674 [Xylaria bambusicola]|uniref:Uncharacterized protein n=1 Tax=Xylaria bambusicola TaxID=326684 RepID=A0AAN7UL54_9PEZI